MSPITILTPVYNGQQFLPAALESVLSQTVRPFEFIVVDDCSTDSTPKILDETLADVPWVRRIRNEKNRGGVGNFQYCTQLAQSEYWVVLNADDTLAPTFIERMTAAIEGFPTANFIFSDYYNIDETGTRLEQYGRASVNRPGLISGKDMIQELISTGQRQAVSTTVVRREAYDRVGGCNPKMDTIHDYESYLRMSGLGDVAYIAEPLGELRAHEGQWSHRTGFHDDGSGTQLFLKLSEYEFMTDAQRRQCVEGLCDHYRRKFYRWLRKPETSLAELNRIREQIRSTIEAWASSDVPQSQYVRRHSRILRNRLAWYMTATMPGLWLVRQCLKQRKIR